MAVPAFPPRLLGILAVAVVVLLAAVSAVVSRRAERTPHNAEVADSVELVPLEGRAFFYSQPGAMGITSMLGILPTAPITVLHVEPYGVTPGTEVLAVRAIFKGRGYLSPSGHRWYTGSPIVECYDGPWPPSGYGPSYPVEGLDVVPGDGVKFVYYIRAPDTFGLHVVTGYRITYRTARGRVRTATGDLGRFEIYFRTAAQLVHQEAQCEPRTRVGWFSAWPGYPG